MKFGVTLYFQNHTDWDRFEAVERGEQADPGPRIPDHQIVDEDLALARLVEPLGFDSLWTVEHHFTPYTMTNNPLMLFSYMAGITERIDFGSMALISPWHHPLRLAEDITMVHNLLGENRRLYVGLGRGAGRREFGGLNVPMGESREMFAESLEVIRLALTKERFSFDGQYYKYPETGLRPRPRGNVDRLLDDMYCTWGSKQSGMMAASAGLRPLLTAAQSWETYRKDLAEYNETRTAAGWDPAGPVALVPIFVAETEEKAREALLRHGAEFSDSSTRHYEIGSPHFAKVKGYEHYATGESAAANNRMLSVDEQLKKMMELVVWGTPDQCIARIQEINDMVNPYQLCGLFKFGSIPLEDAERGMRLFAREVLPAVHEMETGNVYRASA